MKNFKYLLTIIVCLIFFNFNNATAGLTFHGGYTFETFKGQKVAAAYISIFNNTKSDITIEDVQTIICKSAEIHSSIIDKDVMRMKKENSLTVKANDQYYFQPGGTHVMLMGLNKQLIKGTSFILKFKISNGDILETKIMVLDNKLRENLLEIK